MKGGGVTAAPARAGPRVPPVARIGIVAIGIAWALVAEAIRLQAGWPIVWVIGDLLPGLAFLICGYVAWMRRPDVRIGPLMIAVGFAWYAGTAAASRNDDVDRVAHALQGYYDPFLAWLTLAYPSGRLRWRSSRIVVGTFLALLMIRSVFRFAVYRSTAGLDVTDPLAVDRYIADVTLREGGDTMFRIVIAILALAVIALVVRRWRVESAAGRAVAGPILLGGIAFSVAIVVETMTLLGSSSFAERSFAWDVGQWSTSITGAIVPAAFVIGIGQDRLARSRVADLVVSLGEADPKPGDLQSALAEALADPSLVVAYPTPGSDGFVDGGGRPIVLPTDGDPQRAATRIDRSGRAVAVLVHDPALSERPDLLRSVAAAAGLALENERLQAQLRVQLEEVRASRARIVIAGDAERRRVERDLHDGAQQRFVTLALAIQMARARVEGPAAELAAMLDRASIELERGLAELRELARGLHPSILTEDGLAAAIGALAERSAVPVATSIPDRRFEPAIESAAYFVVAEALTNVAKYAPDASASVELGVEGDVLRLVVRDNGPGGAEAYPGSGLQGLEDRVAAVGGRFAVESPIGKGTTITAELQCA
jgi:signal transduction histidine kinase